MFVRCVFWTIFFYRMPYYDLIYFTNVVEPCSSVSIVSGYGLDDQAIEVRSPPEARSFSCSFCVQTGSGAHPASFTMGTGDSLPGAEVRPGRDADHSPHLVPRSRMSKSYNSPPPPSAFMACSGTALAVALPMLLCMFRFLLLYTALPKYDVQSCLLGYTAV
jgi:hypothetical protein